MKKILALSCCCVDFFPEKNIINVGGNALKVLMAALRIKTALNIPAKHGDSYQGAFIVDYLVNGDILSAMKAGSQSAALTLSYIGAF